MKYSINLAPANPKFSGSLKKYESDINAAIEDFNNKNKANEKSIILLGIEDRLLSLELQTPMIMPAPAKGLRSFTKYLIENTKLGEESYFGSLFRSTQVSSVNPQPSINESNPPEVNVMSKLTYLLIDEDTNKEEYFSLFNTIFDITNSMDSKCRHAFIEEISDLIIAKGKEYGH